MPLTYVSATQINAQVPYDTPLSVQEVVVRSDGATSPIATVNVAPVAPGIFQFGANRAVVQNDDYSVNTADNPAKTGSYVIAYLTGAGEVGNPVATGMPASAAFAGLTPSFVGLTQVNFTDSNSGSGHVPAGSDGEVV